MRPLFLLALPLAACAASATERATREETAATGLARELAGLTRGPTSDCLPVTRNAQTRAYGSTIVYTFDRDRKFVSRTTGGCEAIGRGDAFVTSNPIGRTCRGDIAQTFDAVARIPTGSCAFGAFTEYSRR